MNFGKKSVPFKPQRDMPPLDGKVILVTGGNAGLGRQCVLEYARRRPAHIWLAARALDKARAAADEIAAQLGLRPPSNVSNGSNDGSMMIKPLELDLASLASVRAAARTVLAESDRLNILMLNAGVMAAPPALTRDGYELQFGTNYLGHALLAKLLLPLLERTATASDHDRGSRDVRVVMVSSHGQVYAPKPEGIRFGTLRSPEAEGVGPYGRYGQSKLAMVLWVRHAARLYRDPRLTFAAVHPGVVGTELMDKATGSPFLVRVLGKLAKPVATPVEQGVRNQLWASVGEGVVSGEYYEPVGIGGAATKLGKDDALAARLWEWTEKELASYVA